MCIRDSPLRITVWSDPRTNSSLHTVLELDQSACPESRRSGLSGVSGCTHPTELASIFHATVDLPVADLGPAWGLHRRARRRTKTRRSGRVRVSESPGGRGWAGVLRRAQGAARSRLNAVASWAAQGPELQT